MKKHKKWLSICLVVCLIAGTGGALWYRQHKIEERRLSLIYIPKVVDGTNDFWKALILGAKMAAKEYNADIDILAPSEENDVERQNELLKEAIDRKPDAILFSPSSFTESNGLLKEAKEDGIRISFIDSYTEEDIQDLTVATDNLEAGEKLGKFAATLLGPDDQIAIVAHVKGVSTAVEREEGFRKGLGDLADNIVDVVYCDSQYEKSRKLTLELMEKLGSYCDEFLVHAVDVEGKAKGIEVSLAKLLGKYEGHPVTYAGGVGSVEDIQLLKQAAGGKVDVTVGSALDLFGGTIPFEKLIGNL